MSQKNRQPATTTVRLSAEEVVEWFNDTHDIGTPVTYWPGVIDDNAREGQTRTPAWVLPSGEPVVSITGYAGGIHLSHIVCAFHPTHAKREDQ